MVTGTRASLGITFLRSNHKKTNGGEIRAILCTLEHKAEVEQLVVVVDSQYVFDALTKNLLRCERNCARGHRGLCRIVTSGLIY